MANVQKLLDEALGKKSSKKTKNRDLFLKSIIALCEDDEYVATTIASVSSAGEIITKKEKLAPKFRKLIANAIAKCTSLSKEEALEAAKSYRVTMEDADTIYTISTEAVYLNTFVMDKKVELHNKPDAVVALEAVNVPETVRNNPKDPTKQTVIAARKKSKLSQKVMKHQKTVRDVK